MDGFGMAVIEDGATLESAADQLAVGRIRVGPVTTPAQLLATLATVGT